VVIARCLARDQPASPPRRTCCSLQSFAPSPSASTPANLGIALQVACSSPRWIISSARLLEFGAALIGMVLAGLYGHARTLSVPRIRAISQDRQIWA